MALSVKVRDATGKVIYERNKGDLAKTCGYDRIAIYEDNCWYDGTFQAQVYPYSVEYESVTQSESLFFLGGAVFQSTIPVLSAEYTVVNAKNLDLRYKSYGLASGRGPEISSDASRYTWRLTDLPALEDIDHIPPGAIDPARLAITPVRFKLEKYVFDGSSWAAVGESLLQLYEGQYLANGEPRALPGAAVSHEAVRACFDDVRRGVRYVAIEVGLGRWRPYSARMTQERGFGDCKDMATLLVSRLRNLGLQAYPVFVQTRQLLPIDPNFPEFGFNHVISVAVVGGDTVWLDPTCDVCPYGELPLMDRNVDVLAGTPGGGRLWRTPFWSSQANTRGRITDYHVAADLSVTFTSELAATGVFAQHLRRVLPTLNNDETRSFIEDLYPGAGKRFAVQSYELRDVEALDRPVIVYVKAVLFKPARRIGHVVYFAPFDLVELSGFQVVNLDDRAVAVNTYYPETEFDSVNVSWDTALLVDSVELPLDDSLFYPFAEMCMRASGDSTELRLALTRSYHVYQIDPSDFSEFDSFRKRLKDVSSLHVKMVVR